MSKENCIHKPSLQQMFNLVVHKYDYLNRILTWGLDDVWRKMCARECASGKVIVDLCCGTGKLAFQIQKLAAPGTYLLGLDFSREMLRKAVNKKLVQSQESGHIDKHDLSFIFGDACNIPFKDECIDRIGISFSFRNLMYKNPMVKKLLGEALRILRPGGKLVCIETSQPEWAPLRILYHLYLRKIVLLVGGLISRHKDAYRYLSVSAIGFPTAAGIVDILLEAGFRDVAFKHIALGSVAIHVCLK